MRNFATGFPLLSALEGTFKCFLRHLSEFRLLYLFFGLSFHIQYSCTCIQLCKLCICSKSNRLFCQSIRSIRVNEWMTNDWIANWIRFEWKRRKEQPPKVRFRCNKNIINWDSHRFGERERRIILFTHKHSAHPPNVYFCSTTSHYHYNIIVCIAMKSASEVQWVEVFSFNENLLT